jgi:hypothetical protein
MFLSSCSLDILNDIFSKDSVEDILEALVSYFLYMLWQCMFMQIDAIIL